MSLPPATFAEGPLGLEGHHTFRGLTLNVATKPRYKLDQITGLRAKPEADDAREGATGAIGEIAYPSLKRGRTITYNGRVMARSLPELRQMTTDLLNAFSEDSTITEFDITPPSERGGVGFMYFARVLSCDVDDAQMTGQRHITPWQRTFILAMRQTDPRYYGDLVISSGNANGASVTLTNQGWAPGLFLFKLNGPITSPVKVERTTPDPRYLEFDHDDLEDVNGGKQLWISDGPAPSCSSPQIPGSDYSGMVTFNSNWWDDNAAGVAPGDNTFRVTGCANWEVAFRHASW